MAKYKRKQTEVEAVNWDEFIEYGKEQADDLIEGMPWSFNYKGNPVTHENDQQYYITSSVGGGSYYMEPRKMLVMYDDGSVNTLSEFHFNQFYELDVQSKESETELAIFKSKGSGCGNTYTRKKCVLSQPFSAVNT